MNKNEILTELYTNRNTTKIIDCIAKNSKLKDDLKSEVFLYLAELPEEKILDAYNKKYLNFLLAKIVKNQFYGKSTKFNKHHKQKSDDLLSFYDYGVNPFDEQFNNELKESALNAVYDFLEKQSFLDRELFKMYYKIGDYNPIDGKLRDVECDKPTSTFKNIAKKLAIGVNMKGNLITVTESYSYGSINRTLIKLKNKFDGYFI